MGESVFAESGVIFLFAILVWFFFHLFVVYNEEPGLEKRFGQEYRDYKLVCPGGFPECERLRNKSIIPH